MIELMIGLPPDLSRDNISDLAGIDAECIGIVEEEGGVCPDLVEVASRFRDLI